MSPTLSSGSNTAQSALLDTRYQVETPEGIDLVLRPAGAVPRALAFAIDFLIRAVILAVLFTLLAMLGQFGIGLSSILLFVVHWWYMVLFEVLNQGRTPGKKLLGLRVIHDDGTPIGWQASLTRNLLRTVDMLPFAYAFGLLSCLNHPAFKRLGDIAAGTLVVYQDSPPQSRQLSGAQALAAPFAMSLNEQRALIGFSERADDLSASRRQELAEILADPLRVPPELAESQIHGIARGLMGPT
ncbi:RDD family protein [Ectopseudomonas mendocina]|uniref:RDD family protein n=1 Tax=Ectopseudomonas mendocina TaxID=300 RepID=A0ABZ2REP5_ECTME